LDPFLTILLYFSFAFNPLIEKTPYTGVFSIKGGTVYQENKTIDTVLPSVAQESMNYYSW
jgi:hypothetical protein